MAPTVVWYEGTKAIPQATNPSRRTVSITLRRSFHSSYSSSLTSSEWTKIWIVSHNMAVCRAACMLATHQEPLEEHPGFCFIQLHSRPRTPTYRNISQSQYLPQYFYFAFDLVTRSTLCSRIRRKPKSLSQGLLRACKKVQCCTISAIYTSLDNRTVESPCFSLSKLNL